MRSKHWVVSSFTMLGGILLAVSGPAEPAQEGLSKLELGAGPRACSTPSSRTIEPLVSVEWLSANLDDPNLVIIDIRPAEAYDAGHIPGAISEPFEVPFSAWITMRDDLLLEVPDETELFAAIGSLGIAPGSSVVVVSASNPDEPFHYGLANANRVADTLIYAGVSDVGILNGGHTKWVADGLPTTTEVPTVSAVTYEAEVNERMFVSKEYVKDRIGRAVLIDARDPDVYFGAAIEAFAPVPGHIPTARSLPAPWIWFEDETYDDPEILGAMAAGVVGSNKCREVIVYCGVGGYTSSWWYILTQVLGYRNVKIYDGSAQDWVQTEAMLPYRWE